ncbi:MAG: hypothetical protein IK149_03245 [Oscillospiraceae bacterium]|nr:hypothetical protein [Oscillospiraceae bacterium]
MSDNIEQAASAAPEEDILLPEGWTEDEDLFSEDTADDEEGEESLLPRAEAPETAPTTGESPAADAKLRFTARVDHEDRQVELDASELPALWQKAQATERAQRRLRELSELKQAEGGRDLGAETEELLRVFPEMRGRSIPNEVVLDALRGKRPLTAAFAAWTEKQHRKELLSLQRENSRREAGQSAARRAPVRGVSGGGGADTRPADPFLSGFNSGW